MTDPIYGAAPRGQRPVTGARNAAAVISLVIALFAGIGIGALLMQGRTPSPAVAAPAASAASVLPAGAGFVTLAVGEAAGARCGADACVFILSADAAARIGAPGVRVAGPGQLLRAPVPAKLPDGPLFLAADGTLHTVSAGATTPVALPADDMGLPSAPVSAYAVACDGDTCIVAVTCEGPATGEGLLRWTAAQGWRTVAAAPGPGGNVAPQVDRLGLRGPMIVWVPVIGAPRYTVTDGNFYAAAPD